MEYILSRPPSQVGKRLRSERELAKALKIDRSIIQKVFDQFVEKGYLARRHGSGTYVRKVTPPMRPAETAAFGITFSADRLFADGEPAQRKSALAEHRQLKLAFIDGSLGRGESQKLIIAGIEDRVKQAGHKLKFYTPKLHPGKRLHVEDLTEKLHSIRCDGYILWSLEAPVIDIEFLKKHAPAVYVGDTLRHKTYDYYPLVCLSFEDAMSRALDVLVDQGFEKIGYIGLSQDDETSHAKTRNLFEWSARSRGRTYHQADFCSLNDKSTTALVKRMFLSGDAPQAVFVADDIVLRYLVKVWKKMNIIPGRDVAVIVQSNRDVPLPAGYNWSRVEFNPFQLGRMVVDSLVLEIQTAGEALCSIEHLSIWRAGSTHILQK